MAGNSWMEDSKKNNKKLVMEGLKDLVDFGGFIGETALEGLMGIYSDWTIDTIMSDENYQPSDFSYADALDRVCMDRHSDIYDVRHIAHDVMGYGEDTMEYGEDGFDANRYMEWFLKNVYRYEKERRASMAIPFWRRFDLGQRDKRALKELSAFEEYLLYLMQGVDRGEARTVEEVAELDLFAGDGEYVCRCCRIIEKVLERGRLNTEKFSRQCVEQRIEGIKEG